MDLCRTSTLVACVFLAAGCSSSSSTGTTPPATDGGGDPSAARCYPDNDGITGGASTIDLTVDDTGFSKLVVSTQNDAQVKLTLKNTGTKKHGFFVGCTTTVAPAGCSTHVCFPDDSTIAPIEPGLSKTITFDTPVPDGIIYPFTSNEPDDATVKGLNDGQWSLN